MSDDKIDEIRREHFGVSDDEMDDATRYKRDTPPDDLGDTGTEQYGPLTRGMLKRCIMPTGEQMQEMYDYAERSIKDHLIINPSAPFTVEKAEEVVSALREALPPYRRLEPKPGCYKDAEATEPCTEPNDPVGAVVYESMPLDEGGWRELSKRCADVLADAAHEVQRMTDEMRNQQRIQLVDGWPGDWRSGETWGDEAWRLPVKEGVGDVVYAKVYRFDNLVRDNGHRWGGVLCIQSREDVDIGDSRVFGETPYDVARKLRPHGEALAACLRGMRDE